MRTLVLDCATAALSLALFDDDDCTARRYAVMGRGHAERLVPMIGEMLAGGRADAVAVDVGPGSFTGIRVGIAAARALGLAWGVPVTGYGCLALCAAMARADGNDGAVAIVMTGGHGELFAQRFDGADLAPLGPLVSAPAADLALVLADARVHGTGAGALVEARGWGEAIDRLPDARFWSLLPASRRILSPTAIYGREADARPMAAAGEGRRMTGPSLPGPSLIVTVHDISAPVLMADCMGVMNAAFDPVYGEAWTIDQTRSMLDLPGTFLAAGRLGDAMVGFGLLRAIAGEAELLLLGVDPAVRRKGYGRIILQRCIEIATRHGADTMFLEVREGNEAVALYRAAYFEQYNCRPDYYVGRDGQRRAALSFKRPIVT